MKLLFALLLALGPLSLSAQIQRLNLVLPTDNRALLEGRPGYFSMFVTRTVDVQATTQPGPTVGASGTDPTRLTTGETLYARFHEGLDIKPMVRDERGEPQDEVRSIAPGEVVHSVPQSGRSNYGRYVVVKHD